MFTTRVRALLAATVVAVMALMVLTVAGAPSSAQQRIGGTLNILVMPGYEEDQIIKPFEQKYGVKVNAKIYPSSDQMFSMLSAARPGEWDVTTPDTPWIAKLVKANLLMPLNASDYPMIGDFFSRWKRFDQNYVENTMYGIVSRFGFYGVVYNSKHVKAEETRSIKVMWSEKYRRKIVLFDWYLPNMGMLGRYLGFKQPYRVTGADYKKLEDTLMSLRPQVGIIAATNSDTIQSLANESAWLSFGGEWLQVLLKEQGRPIELTIPDEGGVSWTEALVILKNSQNPAAAKAYVQYILTPEVQAKLAWANAFHAMVPNKTAARHLKPEQARAVFMDDAARLERILERIATREIPANEDQWKLSWERFKSR
jgi:spermidine/putrescine transport system substrate-binding protein